MSDPRPPAWARALLARVLPGDAFGRGVRDDLDSEFREMAAGRSAGAARRWYAWEAVKLAGHFAWDSMTAGSAGQGGGGTMERMMRNVGLAVRRLRRTPGFAAVAVVTLALGVGANVAIFSVVDAVLLQPLPYADADRLVAVFEWNTARDDRTNVANPGNFRDWRDRSSTLASMTAVSLAQPATVRSGDDPRESMVQYAHPDFFEVLGMEAAVGRTFVPEPGGAGTNEAVLRHGYWMERFGGDPGVVGRTLQVNATPAVVVGVLPPDYVVFGEGTDLWLAIDLTRGDQTNTGRWVYPVGRMADGVAFGAVQAELTSIMATLRDEYPEFNAGWDVNPVPLKQQVVGDVRGALWILLGAVGLLLLIACANVANLFLVQATERQREMAVRTSLGASGRALAGQLLTESLVVAGLGSAAGVALAWGGTRALATRMPDAFALPRVEAAGLDGAVLLFALGLTVFTGLLFGLVPALQAARTAPAATLNAEGRGPSERTGLLRNGLVVAEVALSVVLLAGAALFGRSLVSLLSVDPGIEPERVVVGRVNLNTAEYGASADRIRFFESLVTGVAERPGVATVGGVTFLPMAGPAAATGFYPADRPAPPAEDRDGAGIRNVVGDYFGAMGIELLQGRRFGPGDVAGAPQVVVVNRTLAERYWPGETAVGKPLVVDWVDDTPWEVVGVVEDVRVQGLDQAPDNVIYMNYAQAPFFPFVHVVARGDGPGTDPVSAMRAELAERDPSLPLGAVRDMESIVSRSAARPRMTAFLMAVFAGLATLLASVGLYGVLSYTVSRRVREIGVRIALGARPRDVLGMVVRQGASLAAVGLALGLLASLAGGRLVAALLFGIEPTDPAALAAAATLLLAVAVLACVFPAWRAARVPPAEALRSE